MCLVGFPSCVSSFFDLAAFSIVFILGFCHFEYNVSWSFPDLVCFTGVLWPSAASACGATVFSLSFLSAVASSVRLSGLCCHFPIEPARHGVMTDTEHLLVLFMSSVALSPPTELLRVPPLVPGVPSLLAGTSQSGRKDVGAVYRPTSLPRGPGTPASPGTVAPRAEGHAFLRRSDSVLWLLVPFHKDLHVGQSSFVPQQRARR